MNVLVLLAVAGVCIAHPHGFLSDTPEVIAEKQRFFQLYNEAARAAAAAPDHNQFSRQASTSSSYYPVAPEPIWRGPLASSVPAGVNGNFEPVQDTPEVSAAKASFNAAYQQQLRDTAPSSHNHHHQQTHFSHHQPQQTHFSHHQPQQIHFSHHQPQQAQYAPSYDGPRWTGPFAATVPAGLPGSVSQVRNTPEVEAATAEFTRAYNAALAGSRRNTHHHQPQQTSFSNSYPRSSPPIYHPNSISGSSQKPKWTGPLADTIPAGLPGSSSQVHDTPEVAAAKAAHHRAHQQLSYSG